MALISCDMRFGRTDEQKRQLAAGLAGRTNARRFAWRQVQRKHRTVAGLRAQRQRRLRLPVELREHRPQVGHVVLARLGQL